MSEPSTGKFEPASSARALAAIAAGAATALGAALVVALLSTPAAWEYGGRGGDAARVLCEQGELVAGARVFTKDEMVAGIALLCRTEAGSDTQRGTLGAQAGSAHELRCPRGSVAVGMWGGSGKAVDRFSLTCAPARHSAGPDTYLAAVGGHGGSGFHARCAHAALHGLQGAAGAVLDRVGLVCGDAHE